MNETLLMIFIGVSTLAIVVQAAMVAAMYATTKKTSRELSSLAEEVRGKALPTVESIQTMLVENKPRVEEILDNLTVATTTAKSQLLRVDATLNDVLDRTRLQVMRADELATSTMDRIEETTEIVQHTIVSPVRRISGILSGVTRGLGMFVAARQAQKTEGRPRSQSEDMFI